MLQTFTDNRAEAVTAEETAASNHANLMTAKNSQLSASKQALLDKAGENGVDEVVKAIHGIMAEDGGDAAAYVQVSCHGRHCLSFAGPPSPFRLDAAA